MNPPVSTAANARSLFILTHEFHPRRGGIATYCEGLARAAAAAASPSKRSEVGGNGGGVEVWAQALARGEVERTDWPFVVRRLPLRGSHGLRCQWTMARFLVTERRRLRKAVVHLAEPGPMLAAMLLLPWRSFCPERLVLTFHGSEILRFHANPVSRLLTRWLIRRAWRVSTLTHYTRELLCECFPEAAGKVVIAPGAVREQRSVVREQKSEGGGGRLVVLTVGRLHPRKGQIRTLAALAALPEALRRQVEYRLVGTARSRGYEAVLRKAAARAEAAGLAVRFLGDVPDEDLGRVYAEADVFAMTSVGHGRSVEGFGLVYLEAAARGLPVVAHDVGGVSEAVRAGETGLLVNPACPEELTAAFVRLLGDAELRRRMGEAGRVWARRSSWAESAALLYGGGGG
ncbi:glycosyltransferase family 1 protein [Opitutaceae bacterium TAV3]|nr:glycosyltransferase family 1 protein [Opitutaceae bacterium TAV3]